MIGLVFWSQKTNLHTIQLRYYIVLPYVYCYYSLHSAKSSGITCDVGEGRLSLWRGPRTRHHQGGGGVVSAAKINLEDF
ncbi:hypothetical protein SUGI_1131700 [Cryptomeria japonica]|nr:hypothetical protein SUGI_1131700 [Cryptomeria japonica]